MATEMELVTSDKVKLERLNQEYVDAFMNADVERNWRSNLEIERPQLDSSAYALRASALEILTIGVHR